MLCNVAAYQLMTCSVACVYLLCLQPSGAGADRAESAAAAGSATQPHLASCPGISLLTP
jgi:hypothetical protein